MRRREFSGLQGLQSLQSLQSFELLQELQGLQGKLYLQMFRNELRSFYFETLSKNFEFIYRI